MPLGISMHGLKKRNNISVVTMMNLLQVFLLVSGNTKFNAPMQCSSTILGLLFGNSY